MDSTHKIITKSSEETKNFGREFANSLKGGEILALTGNLGSGKTTFIQGLAQGLGIEEKVISPTFILMREYEGKSKNQKAKSINLYHIDLYRLEREIEKELRNMGVTDIWGGKDSIVVIEWADKAKELMPKNTIWIDFEGSGDNEREITINH